MSENQDVAALVEDLGWRYRRLTCPPNEQWIRDEVMAIVTAALASQARDLAAAREERDSLAERLDRVSEALDSALPEDVTIEDHVEGVRVLARELEEARAEVATLGATADATQAMATQAIRERDVAEERAEHARADAARMAGAANEADARAKQAESALAKVAERLATATEFDAGKGVTVKRVGGGWCVTRKTQPRGNRWLNEYMTAAGEWQRAECVTFPDVDAALAALAVARG